MTHPRTVVGVCGSLRAASINLAVLRAAAAVAPPTLRVELYPSLAGLPLFNPDLDATALALVAQLRERIVTAARLVESGCVALPILGSGLDARGIASHAQHAASLRGALLASPLPDPEPRERGSLDMYTKKLYAGWADMDFNSHMKNTAYLDKTADVRQMFLIEQGFPMEEFVRLRIGPVVMKDEVEYFREVGLQQEITVTYALAGHAPDGSRFLLRHEIFRTDGKLAARVSSAGGWLNLDERKLIAPPPALLAAMNLLDRTSDFLVLPSSVSGRA
jgi:acyl-CoA thioester hydrolase